MEKRKITRKKLDKYRQALVEEEKSPATIDKYMRDMESFKKFTGSGEVTKETVIEYKHSLQEKYAPGSVNTMLASVNGFLKSMGWYDCVVKSVKIQHEAFRGKGRELTRDDYYKLLKTAKALGKERLWLIMQTMCSTGIRVSELKYITVEAVGEGFARVNLKGKNRCILIPDDLAFLLSEYIKKNGITQGSVFITRGGMPVDRSNINHEMKQLCEAAGIDRRKVYPHNLRHLFACVYYENEKNLNNLADIMGHSNINTTRIYTQVSMEKLLKLMDGMGLVVTESEEKDTDESKEA